LWGLTLRNSNVPDVSALLSFQEDFLNLGGRGAFLKNLNTQIYIKRLNTIYKEIMQKFRDIIEIPENVLDLDFSNLNELKEKLLEVALSKFRYLDDLDKKFNVISLVSKSKNTVIEFPDKEYKINLNTSGSLLFYEKINYKILQGDVFINIFEIDPKEKFGNGKNEYRITSVIRDIYKINVMADSEEEARQIASNVDLCNWNHLDIDVDLPEIKLTKYSRWGNLIVDKLS